MLSMRFLFAVVSLALLLSPSRADFDRDDIEREFTLRIGSRANCADRIEFDEESFVQRARDIRVEGTRCTGGTLTVTENPRSNPTAAVAFLLDENDSGDFLAGTLDGNLMCGGFGIRRGARFVFLEPEDDFRVTWTNFFDGPSGIQQADGDNNFEFDEDTRYLIIGDDCLYTGSGLSDVCFPAKSKVKLESGRVVRMDMLKTGDNVQVGPGLYSPVIGWTHRDPLSAYAIYTRIATSSGDILTATEGHYVYADKKLMKADDVREGMNMRTGSGLDTVVMNVMRVTAKGLYNPQTAHGDIVVDGLVTSTYTTSVPPSTAHALLAPIRAMFKAVSAFLPIRTSTEL